MEGYECKPRGRVILEQRPLVLQLTDPRFYEICNPNRKLSKGLMIVEPLQLLAGESNPEQLVAVAPNYAQFLNEKSELDGAYPPRVSRQMPYILDLLERDPETRQAVISIYGERDQHSSKDVPCTETLQFFVRNCKLELLINMRSSDAWLGVPYDLAQFCLLQLAVHAHLRKSGKICNDLELGTFTLIAGSSHLYKRDLEKAEQLIRESRLNDVQPKEIEEYPEILFSESQMYAQEVLDVWSGSPATIHLPNFFWNLSMDLRELPERVSSSSMVRTL